MNKKQQIQLTEELYDKLHILNNIEMRAIRDHLFSLHKKEEKKHRGFNGREYGSSLSLSAKYFTLQGLLGGMLSAFSHPTGKPVVELSEICYTRYSVLLSRSYGANYAERIKCVISMSEAKDFLKSVSYIDLIK